MERELLHLRLWDEFTAPEAKAVAETLVILVQSGPTSSSKVGPPGTCRGFPRRGVLPKLADFAYLLFFAFFAFIDSRKRKLSPFISKM